MTYRLEGQVHSDGCSVRISTFSNSSRNPKSENWLPLTNKPNNSHSPLQLKLG